MSSDYFEDALQKGMREYIQFQQFRFVQDFLLQHGEALIHATHDIIKLQLGHNLESERRLLEGQLKLLTSGVHKEIDSLTMAEREAERIASFSGHLAELKRRIREQYPDESEEIIERFDDLIEMRLSGKE